MSTLTLPSGNTVELRDVRTLRGRDRNRLIRASDGEDRLEVGLSLVHLLGVELIESWSFDTPVTVESIEDLLVEDYSALTNALDEPRKVLFPQAGMVANERNLADAQSPTEPSDG